MATVVLEAVNKVFANGVHAVADLSLLVEDGEFLVVVGPSGCGKSTALRLIAGLEDVTSGTVSIGGRCVNGIEPKDRDIAMVFQNYALYPHMTVYDNIGFALKMAKVPTAERDDRIRAAAAMLELTDCLDRKPAQLSGGQRQRVAMGRAIVRRPSAFLMDEPLSNLDAKLRIQMRAEITALQSKLGVTTCYVTHDQTEAMTMGDRVAVMKGGRLQQVDTPQNLYDRPANVFVASFIGSPSMNLYAGILSVDAQGASVTIGSSTLRVAPKALTARSRLVDYHTKQIVVGIRPEDLEDPIHAGDSYGGQVVSGEIVLLESLGSEFVVHFSFDADLVAGGDPDAPDRHALSIGRFNPRSDIRKGQRVDVAVNTANLHFFDSESHLAIWS